MGTTKYIIALDMNFWTSVLWTVLVEQTTRKNVETIALNILDEVGVGERLSNSKYNPLANVLHLLVYSGVLHCEMWEKAMRRIAWSLMILLACRTAWGMLVASTISMRLSRLSNPIEVGS